MLDLSSVLNLLLVFGPIFKSRMSQILTELNALEHKLRAHIKASGELKDKSSGANKDIGQLKAEIQLKNSEISVLEEELKVARTASSIQGNGASTAEAKGRINEMVREIDKCISLLNS